MHHNLRFSALLLAMHLPAAVWGVEFGPWQVQASATTNELRGVAWGNGLFVVVGKFNTLLSSLSGSDWSVRSSGSFDYQTISSGQGWFVAGGREATLLNASYDGIHWTNPLGTLGTDSIFGVAYGNGLFVGVGSGSCGGFGADCSLVLTATGPLSFDLSKGQSPITTRLLAVTWASNLFVAVGEQGTILTSPDGAAWTGRSSGTAKALRAVLFHQSRFVAAGDGGVVLVSTNGLSWSMAAPVSLDVYGLASGPQGLVAVGRFGSEGRLHVSADGLLWPGNSLVLNEPLNAVAYGAGCFVAVGNRGLLLQSGQPANAWTKPTSGYWEELFWSRGQLPSSEPAAILVTNSGWKALAIGSSTTANFPQSLAIKRLAVEAPEDSFNQLLLNYAGLSVPLAIEFDLSLGANASLVSSYSALQAGMLLLSAPASFSAQSRADFGSVVLGVRGPGQLDLADAWLHCGSMTLGGGAPGVLSQSGGTNQVQDKLTINGQSIYYLTNGLLEVGTLYPGEEDRPGWTGRLEISGGTVRVLQSLRLGRRPGVAAYSRGEVALIDGVLESPLMEFENGIFAQLGGTNRVKTLNMPSLAGFGWADYGLAGGLLASEQVVLGNDSLGYFVQSGGVHTNSGSMRVYGRFAGGQHTFQGVYRQLGGRFYSPELLLEGGNVWIQRASNWSQQVTVNFSGLLMLSEGWLVSANTAVRSDGALERAALSCLEQTNGVHVVDNTLTVEGIYRLYGGQLAASNIFVGPDGRLQLEQATVQNGGRFTLDNGYCAALGPHYNLGQLSLLSRALSRFADGPQVSTLELGSTNSVVHFLDSHELAGEWNGKLSIRNWSGSTNGGGLDQLFVGSTAQGLTSQQLSRIFFSNPQGLAAGDYPPRILSSGEVVPAGRPTLSGEVLGGQLVFSWSDEVWQLQSATNVAGPYSALLGATSPYTNLPAGPQGFFRLRLP